ncbi:MAG: tripartite tricarboxylate transporter substrate binding protein, partial [Roseomonas sp.]|nr:tripartite tricarboxylate transporter substrate binding protein [Roseomonas sp.]
MLTKRAILAAMPSLWAAPHMASAQGAWPNGPIRIVVPFPPGGSSDALARMLQPQLQADLGVP